MELKKITLNLPPIANYVLAESEAIQGDQQSRDRTRFGDHTQTSTNKQKTLAIVSIDMSRVQIESVRENVNIDMVNDYSMKRSVRQKPRFHYSNRIPNHPHIYTSLKLEAFHPSLQQAINAFSNEFVTKRRTHSTKIIQRPISRGPAKLTKPAVLHPLTPGETVKFIPRSPEKQYRFDLGVSSMTAPSTPAYIEEVKPEPKPAKVIKPVFPEQKLKSEPIKTLSVIDVQSSLKLQVVSAPKPIPTLVAEPIHITKHPSVVIHNPSTDPFPNQVVEPIHLIKNPSVVIHSPSTTHKQIAHLRQKRIHSINESRVKHDEGKGPYLAPEEKVQYDKKLFIDLMRLHAQAYSEKLRHHFNRKNHHHHQIHPSKHFSFENFHLSDYRVPTSNSGEVTNEAFAELLGISDAVDSSILYIPEQLLSIMPERKSAERQEVEDSTYTSLMDYDQSIGGTEEPFVPVLFPVKPLPHNSPEEQEGDHYWIDFEILLERQFELEKEAVSNFGRIDTAINDTLLCRFGRADVVDLVWHFFKHLRDGVNQEKLFPLSVSKSIQQAISNLEGDDVKCVQSLHTVLESTLSHSHILELKSYAGHIRRIVLTSTETKSGMQQMLKRICSLVSGYLFETRFVVIDHTSVKSFKEALIDVDAAIVEEELSAASRFVFEDDNELHTSWNTVTRSEVEHCVLECDSVLNWHSRALEFCVRFIDRLIPHEDGM